MELLLLLLELSLHVSELSILGLEAGETEGAEPLEQLLELELLPVKSLHLFVPCLETVSDFLEYLTDPLSLRKHLLDVEVARAIMVLDLGSLGLVLTILDDPVITEFNLLQVNVVLQGSDAAARQRRF